MAAARCDALAGDGQRVHAAADPGQPGPGTLAGLDLALAVSRCVGRRPSRRGRTGVGPVGLPAPGTRLHQAARMIITDHGGRVPDRKEDLLRLPGVGSYTAAAILAFGYEQRQVVLDTNVRRVLARVAGGTASPPRRPAPPRSRGRAVRSPRRRSGCSLGRRIDGVRRPGVHGSRPAMRRLPGRRRLPVAAGWPARPRRAVTPTQPYHGTDRQCRGALLAVLRSVDEASVCRAGGELGRGPATGACVGLAARRRARRTPPRR